MKKSVTSESQPSSEPGKPAVSERKASANRANAQRSTGPRTAAGKTRSSLNALRHGILARAAFNVTIEGEERRPEFDALVAGFAQEYQPRTIAELLTVQQLAGCYWRLAKVWIFEQEAAWRGWAGYSMPLEEMKEYEDFNDLNMERRIATLSSEQDAFFPKAGLGYPTIPTGASARTVLRYQASVNAMLFRCLNFLERRRKERMESNDAFEEQDYINEATEAAEPSTESAPDAPATETSAEKSAEPAKDAELHKRTQKDSADAPVSSEEDVKSHDEARVVDAAADPNRAKTP